MFQGHSGLDSEEHCRALSEKVDIIHSIDEQTQKVPLHIWAEVEASLLEFYQPIQRHEGDQPEDTDAKKHGRRNKRRRRISDDSEDSDDDEIARPSTKMADQGDRFRKLWKIKHVKAYLLCPTLLRDKNLQKTSAMPLINLLTSRASLLGQYEAMTSDNPQKELLKASILDSQKAANALFQQKAFADLNTDIAEESHSAENLFITKIGTTKAFSSASKRQQPQQTGAFRGGRARGRFRGGGRGRFGGGRWSSYQDHSQFVPGQWQAQPGRGSRAPMIVPTGGHYQT